MLGYSAEEWETDPDLLATVLHPDDRELVLEKARRVRETGEPFRAEYRYIARDGRVVWVIDETHLVRDEQGKPLYVQGFLVDITERKLAEAERDRLQAELQHAHRLEAIGRLAGGVAHDFNNMLTAIKGYSELLIDGLEPGTRQHEEALQIKRATEQASTLPRQLLAFGRKQVLVPELVEINAVMSQTSRLLGRVIGPVELVVVPSAEPALRVRRPRPARAGDLQPRAERPRRDAGRRDAHDHGRRHGMSRPEVAADRGVPAGDYAFLSVADTGEGMRRRDEGARLRAVLHDEARRRRGGARPRQRVRHDHAERRLRPARHRSRATGRRSSCISRWPTRRAPSDAPADAAAGRRRDAARARGRRRADRARARGQHPRARGLRGRWRPRTVSARSSSSARMPEGIDVLVTDVSMPGMGGRELAARVGGAPAGHSRRLHVGLLRRDPRGDARRAHAAHVSRQAVLAADAGARRSARRWRGSPRAEPRADADAGARRSQPRPVAVTCVIADDHPAVLDSVSRYLRQQGIDVVALAARGDEALRGDRGAAADRRGPRHRDGAGRRHRDRPPDRRRRSRRRTRSSTRVTPTASTSPRRSTPERVGSSSRSRRWPICCGRSRSSPRGGATSTRGCPPRSPPPRASRRCRP